MMHTHYGASLHGHEYSPSPPSSHPTRKPPLVRSSFSTPISRALRNYDSSNETSIRPIRRRLSSELGRFPDRVSYIEPAMETMSEDGHSVAYSDGSETNTESRKRRRSRAQRTIYCLGRAAPTALTQKQRLVDIRPKLLLQLQRVSQDSRPVPELDVIPSATYAPRLRKRFPRLFRADGELGTNDIMIVKYDSAEDDDDTVSDDSMANKEVLAVICQVPKAPEMTEICFNSGLKCIATQPKLDFFEFETIDAVTGEKLTSRWFPVPLKNSTSTTSTVDRASISSDRKFRFSIIAAETRKHPVLAYLNKNTLEICDTYDSISVSAGRYPPGSTMHLKLDDTDPASTPQDEGRVTHTIDDKLKLFIQLTAVWVALKVGWCPPFRYNDSSPSKPAHAIPSARRRAQSSSVTEDFLAQNLNETRASTPESVPGSVGQKFRHTSMQFMRGSPSQATAKQFDSNAPLPKRSVSAGTSISTGTTYMQKLAARKVSNAPSTVPSDSEGEPGGPPRRAATTNSSGINDRISTPSPLGLHISMGNTPETPTNQPYHRPAHLAVKSPLQRENSTRGHHPVNKPPTNGHFIQSDDGTGISEYESLERRTAEKESRPKEHGTWRKKFTNLFKSRNSG